MNYWAMRCVTLIAFSLVAAGCAHIESDPCDRRSSGHRGSSSVVIADYILEIPFQVTIRDAVTGLPIPDATLFDGNYGLTPPDWPEAVLGNVNAEGFFQGVAWTLTGNENPYTECNQKRFRGVPVLAGHPGYYAKVILVELPEQDGMTADMGVVYLKPEEQTELQVDEL